MRKICGILGTINLINGNNLVVATHRIFVGIINTQIIWRLAGFDIIPYIPSILHLTDAQVSSFHHIHKILLLTQFFFLCRDLKMKLICRCCVKFWILRTFTFPIRTILLTLCKGCIQCHRNSFKWVFWNEPTLDLSGMGFCWKNSRDRSSGAIVFQWYWDVSRKLKTVEKILLINFLNISVVSINQVHINGNMFAWILISRRSTKRAGTRLFSRGIDNLVRNHPTVHLFKIYWFEIYFSRATFQIS